MAIMRGPGGLILRGPGGKIARGADCCCGGGDCCSKYYSGLYVPISLTFWAGTGCQYYATAFTRSIPRVGSGHYHAGNENIAWTLDGSAQDKACNDIDVWCFPDTATGAPKVRIRLVCAFPNDIFMGLLPSGTVYDETLDCDPAGLPIGFPCSGPDPLPPPWFPYFSMSASRSVASPTTPQDHIGPAICGSDPTGAIEVTAAGCGLPASLTFTGDPPAGAGAVMLFISVNGLIVQTLCSNSPSGETLSLVDPLSSGTTYTITAVWRESENCGGEELGSAANTFTCTLPS